MTGDDGGGGSAFLVWHNRTPDDDDNALLLGVFSSRTRAEGRVERARTQPGFADYPDCFSIDEYPVDEDQWQTGFVRIDSDRWVAEGYGAVLPSAADQPPETPSQ